MMANGYGDSTLLQQDSLSDGVNSFTDASKDFENKQEELKKEREELDGLFSTDTSEFDLEAAKDSVLTPREIFSTLIEDVFPTPEITSLKLGKKHNISGEVIIAGKYIENEWFWKDFLRFFKIDLYVAPLILDGEKDYSQIYRNSMFQPFRDRDEEDKNARMPEISKTITEDETPLFSRKKNKNRIYNILDSVSVEGGTKTDDQYSHSFNCDLEKVYPYGKKILDAGYFLICRVFLDMEQISLFYSNNRADFPLDKDWSNTLNYNNNGKWDAFLVKNNKILKEIKRIGCLRRISSLSWNSSYYIPTLENRISFEEFVKKFNFSISDTDNDGSLVFFYPSIQLKDISLLNTSKLYIEGQE